MTENSGNGYRINRTELVWPGKYDEEGRRVQVPRANLPFQVIERINESRATREARKQPQTFSLFEAYEGTEGESFEEGWRNKLIWGDNVYVMGSLLEKFAGSIDLIYVDPPFATGADFSFTAPVGDSLNILKERSVLEEKAYRDTWGQGLESYLEMIGDRLALIKELLSDKGSLFVHLDPTIVHYVKVLLDDIFGHSFGKSERAGFRNEIIWCYSGGGIPPREFPRKHDVILWYTAGTDWTFNTQYRAYSPGTVQRGRTQVKGDNAKLREEGTTVNDWWPDVKRITSPTDPEKLYYATQKSEALLSRILAVASNHGDLVADFFCGSGTTMAVAEKLGRRWIGCDLGRWGIHVSRKRLLSIEGCRPFEILNLGRYERQFWQGVKFGVDNGTISEQSLYDYLAFVLKLYGAQPVAGLTHLHGKKGNAMVHIGSVDNPVTIDEVDSALVECAALRQSELHVLGWEWEMGLAGPNNDYHRGGLMQEEARRRGIKLLLLQIPREVMEEQAVNRGDVTFFELAYLDAEVERSSGRRATVSLKDFAIENTDMIPEEVRDKVTTWSDYIDYWAVDWDFRADSFMQGWVAYRTRQDRNLPLKSEEHVYEKPGIYRVAVKVIDIFGNDTTQAYTVEVG